MTDPLRETITYALDVVREAISVLTFDRTRTGGEARDQLWVAMEALRRARSKLDKRARGM